MWGAAVLSPLVSTTVRGVTVGLETPYLLLAIPVVLALLGALVFRGDGMASSRSRRLLYLSRLLVIVLVVVAAAGPYTVDSRETPGEPRVTLLVDRSDSMAVTDAEPDALANAVESRGVPVTVATVGDGTSSRVGDAVAANLRENGTVVVLSDGQVTGGRSLASVAEVATDVNATVHAVELTTTRTERSVEVFGPEKTSAGVDTRFLARVSGVETGNESVTIRVSVDGSTVAEETVDGEGAVEFSHAFETVGSHRVTATITSDDRFASNDVFRKTVRVVERPTILYVSSRGDFPFRSYLAQLYDVRTATQIPSNLDPYYAVVMQDRSAENLGDVDALQRFVIDGNGLLAVGGDNSFEKGGYAESQLASMLPVTVGPSTGDSANIALLIDVSGSAGEGMTTQKAIALDVLDQLGDENNVGLVGFNWRAYRVADVQPLADNRGELEDKIRRLQAGGATSVAAGLRGAGELLGDRAGTVILISDGRDPAEEPAAVARRLRERGIQVISVGVGSNPNEPTLRAVAQASGGTYLRATETNRLRILFGGPGRQFQGQGLTIVNSDSFITSGVELTAQPGAANDVSMRRGADFLVATESGTPAVASWRFGLGRVATITAYGADGTLDGLLQRPDSLLLTKATNYAIGDPERKATDYAEAADTRVGVPTTVRYHGAERPSSPDVRFRKVGNGLYAASVSGDEQGFVSVLDATFAVNYPAEYGAFGLSEDLRSLVGSTDGQLYRPNQAAAIARDARESARRVRTVREDWTWLALTLALVVYLLEVFVRRIQVYRGRTRSESGLT